MPIDDLLRSAIAHVGESVELLGPDGLILWVNPAFERDSGYPRQEAVGRLWYELASPADDASAALLAPMKAAMAARTSWVGTFRLRRRDGKSMVQEVTLTPLEGDGIEPGSYLAVKRDITDKQQLKDRMRLADAMSTIGRVTAGVAHELNNPLAYVIANLGFLADLLERPDEVLPSLPEMRDAIQDAREGATRMQRIVRDVKSLSRADGAVEAVDIARVVTLAVNMASTVVKRRAVACPESMQGLPAARGNSAQLGQVLLNLLVNAAEALPDDDGDDHQISVTSRLVGERITIEVRDNGPGIPDQVLERIFEPFYTTKPAGSGTGLGLSICQTLMTEMGGELHARNDSDGGAVFTVTLRRADSADADSGAAAVRCAGRLRVLVVDDEPLITKALTNVLGAYEVTEASGGADGLRKLFDGSPPDVVLCDLLMPDMSGMDLYHQVCERAPELASRFVFMTGAAFTPRARSFVARVPNPCLEKPLDAELVRRVIFNTASAQESSGD